MKIGVMLRTIDEKQGIGVYTQNLMDHLLPIDKDNEYVLFYLSPQFLGRYAHYSNVYEKLVTAPNKLIWDQIKIPIEAKRHSVDVIFNTKFTVPLFTTAKTVMVLHGSEWFVYPQFSKRWDIFYVKLMMPIYHRAASKVIAVSNKAKKDLVEHAGADSRRFTTIYLAPGEQFSVTPDESTLRTVKERYGLPERFNLDAGGIYPGKNIKNLLRAFAKMRDKIPHKLVIAGTLRHHYNEQLRPIQQYGLEDEVMFIGWVPQEDMPALYRLADLFLFPSFYESCSVSLLEAMASGCPIVTSRTGGTPEVVGHAAMFIEPQDPEDIAKVASQVLTSQSLRQELVYRGLERSKRFSWEKCAKETLAVLERVAGADVTTEV